MDELVFPVLLVSGGSVSVYADAAAFRHAVSLATDKAIRDGFFAKAHIVDSSQCEHRVRELRLKGKFRLLDWMKRSRPIEALELEVVRQHVELPIVKELVVAAIRADRDRWEENSDLPSMHGEIDAARTLGELLDVFR